MHELPTAPERAANLDSRASHDTAVLFAACREGDLDAAREFVRLQERDLIRFAYLLTGDDRQARKFTTASLTELLTASSRNLDDPTRYLALEIARRARREQYRPSWLDSAGGERHWVEDDRTRTKEALGRLTTEQRVALGLTQIMRCSSSEVGRDFGFDGHDAFKEAVELAQSRVARAAGRSDGATTVDLLHRVLVESPAPDLWPEIEVEVSRAWSARRRTERLLTAATIAGVALVISSAIVWVSGYRPGDDGDKAVTTGELTSPQVEDAPASDINSVDNMASFAALSTQQPAARDPVSVPDIHFLRVIEQGGTQQSALHVYDALANRSSPLLGAGGPVLVSPDGRWIVAERKTQGVPGRSMIAGGTVDGSASWQTEIASPRAMIVGNDRVYALNLANSASNQIQILDLHGGAISESWPLSGGGLTPSALRTARLVLSNDSERLYLLTEWALPDGEEWVRKITAFQTTSGDALDEIEIRINAPRDDSEREFSVSSARPLPGENTLYSAVQDARTSQVRLQFLNLETGDLTGLDLPIAARLVPLATQRGENEIHLVPSNTGGMLYVIQSRQRRVAIVDLRTRSLIGVFPLSSSEDDQVMFEGSLNHVTFLEALLSPDGTRLYVAANRERNQAINSYPSQSPVWVIDTSSWEAVDRWMVSGLPRRMTMSGDGSSLFVRTARADGRVYLTTLDTSSGKPVNVWDALPSPNWANIQRIVSLAQIYHEQHGVRPISGPAPPADNQVLSVLPGVRVEADGAVAGAESVVSAFVVHPVSGEPANIDSTLRFDPGATVVIELIGPSDQTILVPASAEPGVYQGRTRMNAAGSWDARVTVINQDGATWTVVQPDAISVAEGLVAENGEAYRFVVRPANPVNRRTITLRVQVIDSRTLDRLPEGTEFLDRISQDAHIILSHPEGGVVETRLSRIDQSTFLGWARFEEAGLWNAEIVVSLVGGEQITISAGAIEINDLTEPYRRADSSTPAGGAGSASD